jgi:hypothetical protein
VTDARQAGDPVPRLAAFAALAALVGWVVWQRAGYALSSPYPHGIDGYFYAAQLGSLIDGGGLRWPSAPLTFWLLWPLAAIAGPVVAVKIGAPLLAALVAAPVYGMAREVGAPRAVALAAAALAATSPAVFYFGVEFVKNGAGMTAAALAIWAALVAARRRDRRSLILVALALIAAWLTHKSAAVIAAVAIAPIAVPALRDAGVSRRALTIAAAVAVAAIAAIGLLAPRRFVGAGDLALAGDLFSSSPDFGLPVQRLGDRVLLFAREVWLAAAAAIGFAALWIAGRLTAAERSLAGLAGLALLAAIPFIDVSDPGGAGFRLRLTAFLPLAALVAVLGSVAARRAPQLVTAAALALAGFVAAFRPPIYLPPVVEQHPALIAAVGAAADHVPATDVVITPERRLVFAYSFLAKGRAAQSPGAAPAAHRWRLIPMSYASPALIGAIEIARKSAPAGVARPISLHPYARDGLLLMTESFWQAALAALPDPERERYQRWPRY